MVLVVATYLLPLLVGLGVTQDPSAWELGFFTTLGKQVGTATVLAGCLLQALHLGRLLSGAGAAACTLTLHLDVPNPLLLSSGWGHVAGVVGRRSSGCVASRPV